MFKPSKKMGQNFLADKGVLEKIIETANIGGDDIILEVGPGQGSLTYALANKARDVVAVEKDSRLVKYLNDKFGRLGNIKIIEADILDFIQSNMGDHGLYNNKYKVVGNIPYYLTSHLIRKLLSLENKPSEIILMIQKEVADRLVAKKGEMNLLAISVQAFADPQILFYVSRNSFWPKPKVDSAIISIKPKTKKLNIDEDAFFRLVKAGFSARRKMLVNNLSKEMDIPKESICDIFKSLGISDNARAQELSIAEWVGVYKGLNS